MPGHRIASDSTGGPRPSKPVQRGRARRHLAPLGFPRRLDDVLRLGRRLRAPLAAQEAEASCPQVRPRDWGLSGAPGRPRAAARAGGRPVQLRLPAQGALPALRLPPPTLPPAPSHAAGAATMRARQAWSACWRWQAAASASWCSQGRACRHRQVRRRLQRRQAARKGYPRGGGRPCVACLTAACHTTQHRADWLLSVSVHPAPCRHVHL